MLRLKVGAVHLSYVDKGSGDPILFIPGLIGLAAQWSHQVDYFAKSHRAVAFDHRGVGHSDKPMQEYTTSLLAEDAVALLDALRIGQAHIVGASTGGAIAQVLGLDYPSRVRSLTLVSTWARPDAYYRRVQEMRKRVLLAMGVEPYIKLSSLWTAGPAQFRDMVGLEAYETAQLEQAAPVEVLATRIDATLKHDRLDHLPRITAPTIVVVADDDILVLPYLGATIAAAIPGARLVRMREGGHNCFRRDPAGFNEILEQFLAAAPLTSA
jgi:aminoacrylate hydrolase